MYMYMFVSPYLSLSFPTAISQYMDQTCHFICVWGFPPLDSCCLVLALDPVSSDFVGPFCNFSLLGAFFGGQRDMIPFSANADCG